MTASGDPVISLETAAGHVSGDSRARRGSATSRPTIRDVAAAAGVSKSLASLVYRKPDSVSPVRRERVLAAAEELGYQPNWLARSLASPAGNFVGILVADLHNPLFAEIVDAARAELVRAGRTGLMTSAMVPRPDGQLRLDTGVLGAFGDLRPQGLLVVGSIPEVTPLARVAQGAPIVIASAVPEQLPTAQSVRSNDDTGQHLVIAHLTERGHHQIAHVGGDGSSVAALRERAYRTAMRAHGLTGAIRVEPADFTEEAGYLAARRLLDQPMRPTAITASNDLAALGVLAAAAELGLAVPGDLAVVGYDNTFIAASRRISLTSVDPDNAAIGTQAARWLAAPEAERPGPGAVHLTAPALVVRDSTGGA